MSVVATALLRKAFLQASAVAVLSRTSNAEAAIPNLRSLAEAAGEMHFLLDGSDTTDKARIAFGFALREIRDYYRKFGEDEDAAELQRVETEYATKAAIAPEVFAKVDKLRNYWTKTPRASLVDEVVAGLFVNTDAEAPESLGRQLYKMLSWDEHHVMATFLSVGLNPDVEGFGTVSHFV